MRAMPSPTSSTRPTSSARSLPSMSWISRVRTEVISSALNLIATSLDELLPNDFESRADRGVVEPVADPHHHAADQLGIDLRLQHRLQLEGLPQLLGQPLALVVRKRRGRADLDPDAPGPLVEQV